MCSRGLNGLFSDFQKFYVTISCHVVCYDSSYNSMISRATIIRIDISFAGLNYKLSYYYEKYITCVLERFWREGACWGKFYFFFFSDLGWEHMNIYILHNSLKQMQGPPPV